MIYINVCFTVVFLQIINWNPYDAKKIKRNNYTNELIILGNSNVNFIFSYNNCYKKIKACVEFTGFSVDKCKIHKNSKFSVVYINENDIFYRKKIM